jgi:hypothetical protein
MTLSENGKDVLIVYKENSDKEDSLAQFTQSKRLLGIDILEIVTRYACH